MICKLQQRHPWIATLPRVNVPDDTHNLTWAGNESLDDALTHCQPWADAPKEFSRLTARRIYEAAAQERDRRQYLDKAFLGQIGKRYAGCTLDNFQIRQQGQQKAVDQLRAFIADFGEHPRNLIVYGPTGSGKDHLAAACARAVIAAYGAGVYWLNGQELFADARGKGVGLHQYNLRSRAILMLSDPTAISGPVTPFQAETLYAFLDERYRDQEPTWATVNVSSRKELRERIGAPNADRLLDGAEVLYTNWPSYRQSRNAKQEA